MKTWNQKLMIMAATVLMFSSVGCSNQWREADLGMDGSDVLEILNQLEDDATISGTSSQQVQTFFALKNNPNSSIYYADGYSDHQGALGPLVSVFSVVRYEFVGAELAGMTYHDLSEVRIAFLDLPTESGHQCALMVDVKVIPLDQYVTSFFECTSVEVGGGEFVAVLQNAEGSQIALRSFDVTQNGDLKGVIQLQVSDFDAFGNEQPNGKFSTLVGFGP
ncbi:MAG: hypothetical protein AB7N80_07040 [Bdellovibrionales bacterium]